MGYSGRASSLYQSLKTHLTEQLGADDSPLTRQLIQLGRLQPTAHAFLLSLLLALDVKCVSTEVYFSEHYPWLPLPIPIFTL